MSITRVQNSPARVGGGWLGTDLTADADSWRVELPGDVRDELVELAGKRAGQTPALDEIPPPISQKTALFVPRLRDRLTAGHYFVVVTGFPCEPFQLARDAYWILGLLVGDPVPQPLGDLIGHVEYHSTSAERRWSGYKSAASLPFHSDPADLVTMLCMRSAPSGGHSLLASARTVHDLLLTSAPDLLAALYRPVPQERRTERQPGQRPWTVIPMFGFAADDFSARYVRWHVAASQRHAGAPRVSARQHKAMDELDRVLALPDVTLDMDLQPGDLQLFNNAEVLHGRTAFTTDPNGAGRLLLRLWLSFPGSPELPAEYRDFYGAVASGSYRGGWWARGGRSARIGLPARDGTAPQAL